MKSKFLLALLAMVTVFGVKLDAGANNSQAVFEKFKRNIVHGLSYQEVIDYLDEEKLEYTADENHGAVQTIIRNTQKKSWVTTSQVIKIIFKDNHVDSVIYTETYTGT